MQDSKLDRTKVPAGHDPAAFRTSIGAAPKIIPTLKASTLTEPKQFAQSSAQQHRGRGNEWQGDQPIGNRNGGKVFFDKGIIPLPHLNSREGELGETKLRRIRRTSAAMLPQVIMDERSRLCHPGASVNQDCSPIAGNEPTNPTPLERPPAVSRGSEKQEVTREITTRPRRGKDDEQEDAQRLHSHKCKSRRARNDGSTHIINRHSIVGMLYTFNEEGEKLLLHLRMQIYRVVAKCR